MTFTYDPGLSLDGGTVYVYSVAIRSLSLIVHGHRRVGVPPEHVMASFFGDSDLGQDVQNVLGAAIGGAAGVLDFVGGQADLLSEGAGAFDFNVQDRTVKV